VVEINKTTARIGLGLATWMPSAYTVNKGLPFSRPHPGCHKPNSPGLGIINLFPARESLVSDIPAGRGKWQTIFYTICWCTVLAAPLKFDVFFREAFQFQGRLTGFWTGALMLLLWRYEWGESCVGLIYCLNTLRGDERNCWVGVLIKDSYSR